MTTRTYKVEFSRMVDTPDGEVHRSDYALIEAKTPARAKKVLIDHLARIDNVRPARANELGQALKDVRTGQFDVLYLSEEEMEAEYEAARAKADEALGGGDQESGKGQAAESESFEEALRGSLSRYRPVSQGGASAAGPDQEDPASDFMREAQEAISRAPSVYPSDEPEDPPPQTVSRRRVGRSRLGHSAVPSGPGSERDMFA